MIYLCDSLWKEEHFEEDWMVLEFLVCSPLLLERNWISIDLLYSSLSKKSKINWCSKAEMEVVLACQLRCFRYNISTILTRVGNDSFLIPLLNSPCFFLFKSFCSFMENSVLIGRKLHVICIYQTKIIVKCTTKIADI